MADFSFTISNRIKVKFWKDRLQGHSSLEESYPSLFSTIITKYAWVVEVWEQYEERGQWSPRFSRQFHNWELEGVTVFFQKLQACSIRREENDSLESKESKGGKLLHHMWKVSSSNPSNHSLVQGISELFPARCFWNPWVSMKVGFFFFFCFLGSIVQQIFYDRSTLKKRKDYAKQIICVKRKRNRLITYSFTSLKRESSGS